MIEGNYRLSLETTSCFVRHVDMISGRLEARVLLAQNAIFLLVQLGRTAPHTCLALLPQIVLRQLICAPTAMMIKKLL